MSGSRHEVRDGSGTLWRNDRKQNDRQPDYTGTVRVDGVLRRIAGWKRVTGDGRPLLSLAVTPERLKADAESVPESERPPSSSQSTTPAANDHEFNDDIPF